MSKLLQQLNTELTAVMEDVGKSLVQVRNYGGGAGAGTIWHPEGLIVTNAHVVQRRSPQVVLADGRVLPARLLAHDPSLDLAALAVDSRDLPTIKLGESRSLQPGQWVMSVGHPWGVVGAITAGVVIGLESEREEGPSSSREWIAVSLHLRPGYSGGPLLDVHGRLVGINTMMHGPDVGMAVPVHVVKRFLKEALTV